MATILKKSIRFLYAFIITCLFTVSISSAAEVTIFGPQQFVRTTGAPDVYTGSFTGLFTDEVPSGKLVVLNGSQTGDNRIEDAISSAEIYVNGELIFSQSDFNKNVYLLEANVSLVETNSYYIELQSQPDSYLTISFIQDIPAPSANITAVPDAIKVDETSLLTWTSSLANDCSIEPEIGSVDCNGSITVSPDITTTYTFIAAGPGGTTTADSTITHINSSPVAYNQTIDTNEDVPVPITLTATDIDNDSLLYNIISSPTHGTLSGQAPNLTYTPGADYNGADSFTFAVNDGLVDSNTASVQINIQSVNDTPIANDQTVELNEDEAAIITLTASDVDLDALTYQIDTGPSNGALAGQAPDITYTPAPNYYGTDSFTFKVNDGLADSNTATVQINIIPVNDAPIADDQTVKLNEDEAAIITLTASDVDLDALTYQIQTCPTHGTLSGQAPNLTYTPEADFNGADSFAFIVNDSSLDSNIATVFITILPVNDPPVAMDDTAITDYQTPITIAFFDLLANDSDIDGEALTIFDITQPANGTVTNNGDDTLTYTPNAGFSGMDNFTYTATDGNSGIDTAVVSVTVNESTGPADVDLEPLSMDISGVSIDPQTLEISGVVDVLIMNNGTEDIVDGYELTLFEDVDNDQSFTQSVDNILGTSFIPDGPLAQSSITLSVDISGTAQFAHNLIYAFTDCNDQVVETDEGNNVINNMVDCEYIPPIGQLEPVIKWEWAESSIEPTFNQVCMSPSIAQTNDDNGDGRVDSYDIPDVIFAAYSASAPNSGPAILRILSGLDGTELVSVADSSAYLGTYANLAVGDIDGDGLIEIVGERRLGGLIAFNNDGTVLWQINATDANLPRSSYHHGGPSIADIDEDGIPEIIFGKNVFNNDGTLRWAGAGSYYGKTHPYGLPVADYYSYAVNLDLAPGLELVAGASAYDKDGNLLWENTSVGDGYTAAANFNADPYPEIVVVHDNGTRKGCVFMLDHLGNIIWGPISIPDTVIIGGAPTISDIDGDGLLEIGVAGHNKYTVFNHDGSILWTAPTQDSSSMTASSVFDLDGNGRAEVVYADETTLWVFDGITGEVVFSTPNSSGTAYELPVVADIDNDHHADIIICSNNYFGGINHGIRVFQDANNSWVNTRKIWNQHAYSITNVNEDGTIPQHVTNNWEVYNNFRQNEMLNPFGCIDITSSYLRANTSSYPASVTFKAHIGNGGALFVAPGLNVSFYDGDPDAGGILLGTSQSANRVDPGTYEDVTFQWDNPLEGIHTIYVRADDDGAGKGKVSETDEINNTVSAMYNIGNNAPIADALLDQTVFINTPVQLDGSGSSDPDGDSITYKWMIIDTPIGSTAQLDDPTLITPSFTPDIMGDYTIQLVVNDGFLDSGPDFVTIFASPVIYVPDVVGMMQIDAEIDIINTCLVLGTVTYENSYTVPAGQVISQSPIAGADVFLNSAVDLVVSLGVPMVLVPDVTGMLQADAETVILAADLAVGAITGEYIDIVPQDHIITQNPAPGTSVVPDTPVDIYVSLGAWTGTDGDPPNVTITADPSQIDLNETVTITILAWDNVGVVDRILIVNGTEISLAGNEAIYTADTAGFIPAVITVYDAAGFSATATTTIMVADPDDETYPVVSLDDTDCVDVTDLYNITGFVSDDTGVTYKLQSREKGATDWVTFAQGAGISFNGTLGVFDPTLRRNGFYEILLYAEDLNGNVSIDTGCMIVDGELKLGQVNLPIEDINIPAQGFPLSMVREYDSRVQDGDFGPGWNLPSSNVTPAATNIPGDGWGQQAQGSGIPTYYLLELKRHEVVIPFSDSDVLRFEMDVNPESSVIYPLEYLTVDFAPVGDTQGTLEALDFDRDVVLYNGQLLEYGVRLYNPQRFRLTRVDGTVYVISSDGIESMTDPYGNTITCDGNGIHHSSGASLTFDRGVGNRIETVTDPLGGQVQYFYNADGMLERVVQVKTSGLANRIASYGYALGVFEEPVLQEIQAPDGTVLGQFEYDSDGRVTALIDGEGNRIIYGYDLPNHVQEITDRNGNVTVYEYDNEGNVTSRLDPMGNETTWTYDANGHKLTETDPFGNITSYTHDIYGNMLSETDPLLNGTTYTYNNKNEVLTVTDALGNITTNTYDNDGNLLTTIGPMDGTTTYSYDLNGNLETMTDALGAATSYEYEAAGNIISETDALANTTYYTYDGYGNKLSMETTRTTEDGPVTMTTLYEYDHFNRLIKETDPDGNYIEMEYNDLDKVFLQRDKNGVYTEFEYDANGNQTLISYADGTTEVYTYDGNGNRLSFTDRDGRTTYYEYDDLNRLVMTTYSDNTTTETEYDAAGRQTASIDENGNRTEFEYDEAGRRTAVVDALTHRTEFTYDANGNQLTVTDPNGNVTEFEYDSLNRMITTTYPDLTFSETDYDAIGRKIFETDQAGITTEYGYDEMGRLISVTDALGAETRYAYDEVGNKIEQTDPNGNMTIWDYDNQGRVIVHTLPLGMYETFTYDSNGNNLTHTDFNGNTTEYEYSVCCGRLIRKTFLDLSEVEYTYTGTGQRETITEARGATYHTYDLRNRLLSVENPDGTVLSYTYDEAGNRTSVTGLSGATIYNYDALNRLATVTDPDRGVTSYTYDLVGNRTGITYPNANVTEYDYDTLNRLTYLENKQSDGNIISSFTYTLGPAGNRTRVVENTGRMVDYTYDDVYRLVEEDITDLINGSENIAYTYDAFGNRLTKTDSAGTVIYTYDDNDRLVLEDGPGYTYDYTYDDNGNTIDKSDGTLTTDYAYDYENRLILVDTDTSDIAYTYDADGIRASSSVDGDITYYVVDKNRDYAQVLEERDGTGATVVEYVYGDDLISQERGGADYYYLYDGQMSTRALTDSTETVTDTYIYDAFGSLTYQTGSTENNYLYTGEQYDPNAGFYYLRARYYNQATGRFLNSDPWEGSAFEPITLHKYLYANDNPMMYSDPSGKQTLVEEKTKLQIINTLLFLTAITNQVITHTNTETNDYDYNDEDTVYRALRNNENRFRVEYLGIWSKGLTQYTPSEHIEKTRDDTCWISATPKTHRAIFYASGINASGWIAKIDLEKVSPKFLIYDTRIPGNRDGFSAVALYNSEIDDEVLVKYYIRPGAIIDVVRLSDLPH